ncbi:hypothetical protein BJ138DRAFT_1177071 [Hygrophoropsis aurantiaca]|uniref:Uncharacterized protein n=1 Tax=Hygrophoropsis aurantiaca TaxID=72124 RepID=A0ACB8AP94_9AGAM|nr:hypothetical protein BJ138DRAFT_1177071 [Hygrophoropsis aurantiaca]
MMMRAGLDWLSTSHELQVPLQMSAGSLTGSRMKTYSFNQGEKGEVTFCLTLAITSVPVPVITMVALFCILVHWCFVIREGEAFQAKEGSPRTQKAHRVESRGEDEDNEEPAKKQPTGPGKKNVSAQKMDLQTAISMKTLRVMIENMNIQNHTSNLQETELTARMMLYESQIRFQEASRVKWSKRRHILTSNATPWPGS